MISPRATSICKYSFYFTISGEGKSFSLGILSGATCSPTLPPTCLSLSRSDQYCRSSAEDRYVTGPDFNFVKLCRQLKEPAVGDPPFEITIFENDSVCIR